MKVTVVIPTLNEEEGIGPTLDAIDQKAFKKAGWKLDFLIVDADSTDRTKAESEARGAKVLIDKRRGYGRAYKTGFAAAKGDIIVTGDADGTYPFEKIHEYVQYLLDEDLTFITCDRYGDLQEGSMSAKHRLGNWVLTTGTRTLFWLKLRDSQSGMWIFKREALDTIQFEALSDGMAFSQEMKIEALRRLGPKAREIPSLLRARIGEPVISSWRDGFGNLWGLAKHRFRRLK